MRTYKAPARELIEGDFTNRITATGDGSGCSFVQAQQKIQDWKRQGKYTVFGFGGFDVLGLNHVRGLVQCRAIGAMGMLGIEEIRNDDDYREVHAVAASGAVRLMVSIDTNRTLEEGKSRNPEKGGAPKPTLDWTTRATMVAAQSLAAPGYEQRVNLADFITRQGWECCDACGPSACQNEWHTDIISGLEPDLVVVRDDLPKTISYLNDRKGEGLLPDTQIALINEQDGAYADPVLGGVISTTSIIQRIRS
jgi:hypothetical protein